MKLENQIKKHNFEKQDWILNYKLMLRRNDKSINKSFKVGDIVTLNNRYFGEVTLIVKTDSSSYVIVDYDPNTITDFCLLENKAAIREYKLKQLLGI
jgi:hypothetical protein